LRGSFRRLTGAADSAVSEMTFEFLSLLGSGLTVAFTLNNLGFALIGCLLGTLIGVLPGIGVLATIAMLLPLTVGLSATTSMIMLAGIYYGAQYGGSTTAILVNLPGEATSVVTCLDGYKMAQQGRGGVALFVAAVGSFLAGCIGTVIIAAFAPPLAEMALRFNGPENFSLMMLALVASALFSGGKLLQALAMLVLGVLLGLVGTDVETGTLRYTLGLSGLYDGVNFVAVVMGFFGLAEVVNNIANPSIDRSTTNVIGRFWPTRKELRQALPASLRGTLLGAALGVLPGGGVVISPFASYILEKRLAKDPSRFGQGAIEGVAGPESANNASAQTSFIPMLTLGIPANPVIALLLGAMIIQGIQPGPEVMAKHPELFWGLIASMLVGNLMLLVINLPLIGLWVRLLKIPYRMLFPAVLVFCCIGAYTLNNATFDVILLAVFGIAGIVLSVLDFPIIPLVLGLILGPLAEEHLRRAMLIARGDPMVFIERPISAVILAVTAIMIISYIYIVIREKRRFPSNE